MNKLFKTAAFAVVLAIGFTSCSKDSDNEEPEYAAKVTLKDGETKDFSTVATAKNSIGTINRKGSVYGIRNFRQLTLGQDGKPTTTAEREFFFDFKENDATAATDAMVSFTGYDRAPNLKSNVAKGFSLSYIDKAFDAVSANDQFVAAKDNSLGLNSTSTAGWANYSGSPNYQLIPVANRTFIISKDGKALFKFKINSVYSNEKPEKDVQPTNYFFYSVDYKEFK